MSSPARARASVKRVAAATSRISICSPPVSSSPSAARTLRSSSASWGRVSSSQNTAGVPVVTCARHREPDPVLDRGVLGLAHAPDVALADLVLEQRRPRLIDDAHDAVGGDLERLVVRAVLLGLLRHQPDVRRAAHRRRVERAVLAAVVDGLAVQRRVGVVGDHELRVLLAPVGVPHLPRGSDRGRHRGVDDHVAGHVQVGDPPVGVDHRQRRAVGIRGIDGVADRDPIVCRQLLDRCQERGEPVVRVDASCLQRLSVVGEHGRKERAHRVAEDDRVRDLHHRRLQVDREQHPLALCVGDLLGEERLELRAAHDGGVDHLAGQRRDLLFEHRDRAVGGDVLDPERLVVGERDRALGRAEVAVAHRRDVRARIARPGAHRVRVAARVFLDRCRRAAIGVALAQDRVDGAALDPVVAGADLALLRRRRARPGSRGARSRPSGARRSPP